MIHAAIVVIRSAKMMLSNFSGLEHNKKIIKPKVSHPLAIKAALSASVWSGSATSTTSRITAHNTSTVADLCIWVICSVTSNMYQTKKILTTIHPSSVIIFYTNQKVSQKFTFLTSNRCNDEKYILTKYIYKIRNFFFFLYEVITVSLRT